MTQSLELEAGPRYEPDAMYRVNTALFDVDNTLVGNGVDDIPTERFHDAVAAARGKIAVALASARPLSKTKHILDSIGAEGLSILCNGAQIVDSADGSVVAEWPLEIETCVDLASKLYSLGIVFWINDDGVDYFPNASSDAAYERQSDIWNEKSSRINVPDYRPQKPFVINAHNISDMQVTAIEELVAAYDDDDITTLISHETEQPDGGTLYDLFIVHKRANKKDALAELARLQGLSLANLLAVGDGRNDAVLVGSAGVGIAMGNSAKETLAVATFISASQQDDGAAIALEYALQNFVQKHNSI